MHPVPHLRVSGKAHALAVRAVQETRGRGWLAAPVLRARLQQSAIEVALHIVRGALQPQPERFRQALDGALAALREHAYLQRLCRDCGLLTASAFAGFEARSAELERMLVSLRHRGARSRRAARGAPAPGATPRFREPLQRDGAPQHPAP